MIELRDIHKSFGTVEALRGVSFSAARGTIHGIVGENGAGKSTLMKIITGFIAKSRGKIVVDDQEIALADPSQAISRGIGMLYQEPLDFPQLSVLENFMAGGSGFSPTRERKKLSRLCQDFGFDLAPETAVEKLTVGQRQQLELLRLIRSDIKVLILDEPTTGISERQQDLLFTALETLKKMGATLLLVSHKLDEIDLLCDAVTVLRHGQVAASQLRPFNRGALLEAMFDSLPQPQQAVHRPPAESNILECTKVTSSAGRTGLKELSLSVKSGEIIGLAGVDGSGQSLFLKLAYGLLQPSSGTIHRFGKPLQLSYGNSSTNTVFLPADRLSEGLFGGMSIREHQLLARSQKTFIGPGSGLQQTRQAISTYDIRGNPETSIEDLSGGNQQRLLLSLIPDEVKLILLENPTRGLDVHSAAWTWNQLHSCLAEEGSLLFASPDLEEIMAQASRILVFYEGSIVLDRPSKSTSYQELSRAITGQNIH
jgi:ABC-type uncharacterized transport system ATPase subunit